MIPSGTVLRIPARYRDPTTKVGATGLTVTVDLVNAATGAALVTGAACSSEAEVSGGYYYSYTTLADLPSGIWATFHTTAAASAVESKDIWSWIGSEPALDVKVSGIAASVWAVLTSTLTVAGTIGKLIVDKLGLLTTGTVAAITNAVASTAVSVYKGDDYYSAQGRALTWTLTGVDYTGATIEVRVKDLLAEGRPYTTASAVGSNGAVTLELGTAVTKTFRTGVFNYCLLITRGGHLETRVDGQWTVVEHA
jgi:hypothetical protein